MKKVGELYEKKITCSVCNKKFMNSKVRMSKLKLIKRDTDFLTYYENENPIKYGVLVCPYCGYAAMENKFGNITFEDKNIIKEKISSKWNERSFDGKRSLDISIEAYKLALYIGELLDYKKLDLGNICMRIGWLYRLKGKDFYEEEIRFLRYAKELYEEAYYKESFIGSSMDEITLGYLLGELSRRLGEKEEALKWFNTVLTNPKIRKNPMIDRITREQWMLTREV